MTNFAKKNSVKWLFLFSRSILFCVASVKQKSLCGKGFHFYIYFIKQYANSFSGTDGLVYTAVSVSSALVSIGKHTLKDPNLRLYIYKYIYIFI